MANLSFKKDADLSAEADVFFHGVKKTATSVGRSNAAAPRTSYFSPANDSRPGGGNDLVNPVGAPRDHVTDLIPFFSSAMNFADMKNTPAREARTLADNLFEDAGFFMGATIDAAARAFAKLDPLLRIFDLRHTDAVKLEWALFEGLQTTTNIVPDLTPVRMVQTTSSRKRAELVQRGLGFMVEYKNYKTPAGQAEAAMKTNLLTSAVGFTWYLEAIYSFFLVKHQYDARLRVGTTPHPSVYDSLRVSSAMWAVLQKNPYGLEKVLVTAKQFLQADGVTPTHAIVPYGTVAFCSVNTQQKLEGPDRGKHMQDALANENSVIRMHGIDVVELQQVYVNGSTQASCATRNRRQIGDYGRISSYRYRGKDFQTRHRNIFMFNMDTANGEFSEISVVNARLNSARFGPSGNLSDAHQTLLEQFQEKQLVDYANTSIEHLDMFIGLDANERGFVVEYWGEMFPHFLTREGIDHAADDARNRLAELPGCEALNVSTVLSEGIRLMDDLAKPDLTSDFAKAWFTAVEGGSDVQEGTNALPKKGLGAPALPRIEAFDLKDNSDYSTICYWSDGKKLPVIAIKTKSLLTQAGLTDEVDVSAYTDDLVFALYESNDAVARIERAFGTSFSHDTKSTLVAWIKDRLEDEAASRQDGAVSVVKLAGRNCFLPYGYGHWDGIRAISAFAKDTGINSKNSGFQKHVVRVAQNYELVVNKLFSGAKKMCAQGHLVTNQHYTLKPWQQSVDTEKDKLTSMANLFVDRNRIFSCMIVRGRVAPGSDGPAVNPYTAATEIAGKVIIESYEEPPKEPTVKIYGSESDIVSSWKAILPGVLKYAPSFMAHATSNDGMYEFASNFEKSIGRQYATFRSSGGAISNETVSLEHSGSSLGNFASDLLYAYFPTNKRATEESRSSANMHVGAILEHVAREINTVSSTNYSDVGISNAIRTLVKDMMKGKKSVKEVSKDGEHSDWWTVNAGLVISQSSYRSFADKTDNVNKRAPVQVIMTPSIMGSSSGATVHPGAGADIVRESIRRFASAKAKARPSDDCGFNIRHVDKAGSKRSGDSGGFDTVHEAKRSRDYLSSDMAFYRKADTSGRRKQPVDEGVASGAAGFNRALDDHYAYATSEPDPLLRFAKLLIIFAPITARQCELWESSNVGVPVDFLQVRPFKTYTSECMILTKGNGAAGTILYSNEHCSTGVDVKINALYCHYTYYTKVVIKDPKQFIIIPDVRVVGYHGGEGVQFWQPHTYKPHRISAQAGSINGPRMNSIFSLMCPYGSLRRGESEIRDGVFVPGFAQSQHSITGFWKDRAFGGVSRPDSPFPHYASAAYYNSLYHFDELNVGAPKGPVSSNSVTGDFNEVVWQTKQLVYDAVDGHNKKCVKATDHFGQDLTDDGIKHRRLGELVPDQFQKSDLKYDFVVL